MREEVGSRDDLYLNVNLLDRGWFSLSLEFFYLIVLEALVANLVDIDGIAFFLLYEFFP